MVMILDFPEMKAPPRRRKLGRGRPSAEIVLFPGVRWPEEPKEVIAKPAIERDRLKLIE